MSKEVIFTIVAKNYIGLALILEKSLRKYSENVDFYIVVADEVDAKFAKLLPNNVVIAKDKLGFSDGVWDNLTFKYNLTEFCTAIKPASLLYFLNFADKVIYLDPDILFFSSIQPVFDDLKNFNIILTPHIIDIPEQGSSDARESIWLNCGIFNLGFIGISKSTIAFDVLRWWHKRLLDLCFIDNYEALFTDQKWMDFLPAFCSFNQLSISKNRGMNLAPWNFFEREIYENDEGNLCVRSRNAYSENYSEKLMFVHYSAYDYSELLEGNAIQRGVNFNRSYHDIHLVIDIYREFLIENKDIFIEFIKQPYSYNSFRNGVPVNSIHRRLYRALIEKKEVINNPFFCNKSSFFERLKQNGLIKENAPINIDRATKASLPGIKSKLTFVNKLSRLIFRIVGYSRYLLLIKLFRSYSRFESQIHLIDKKYDSDNIL